MRVNLARLNHILIPTTKEGRDQARARLVVRLARPVVWLYGALTEEGRFLAVVSVLVGLVGVEVQSTSIYLLWCVMTAPLAVALVLRWPFSLAGRARLLVQAPRRVAVGDEIRFTLSLVNDSERAFDVVRVRGPMLPWDGRFAGPPPADVVLDPRGQVDVTLGARFSERGEHHLDPFYACALAPPGLTQGRGVDSESCRLTVVPRLANIKSLHTPRAERHQPGGVALASKTGESMDLLGVRPYRPGDPVRDLHARTSARLGVPHVREFQQEYFSRFGIVLDVEARRASPEAFEAAISLAAGLVAHLGRGEGLIDLLVCGDQLHSLTLGRSLGQLDQALDLLACARPGGPFDPDALLRRLGPFLERLSCLFVLWLTHDEPRRAFAEQLRRRLPCRVFLVAHGQGLASADLSIVEVDAIARGAPLAL